MKITQVWFIRPANKNMHI